MEHKLKSLIDYVQSDGRICPMPDYWNKLWEMLPDRRQKETGGWEPSLPLILAAWWDTTAQEKQERLSQHIKYALDHRVLDEIDRFLRGLKPDQWAYGDGVTEWERWQSKNKLQK